MLEKNDVVIITNEGQTYDQWESVARKLNATKWARGQLPLRGAEAKVVGVYKYGKTEIALIEMMEWPDEGKQYLIGEGGLKGESQCISIWEVD